MTVTSAVNVLTLSRCQPCRDDSVIKSTFARRGLDSVAVRTRLHILLLFEVRNEKLLLVWHCKLFQIIRANQLVSERTTRAPDNDH